MPILYGTAVRALPRSFGRQNPAGPSPVQIPGRRQEPGPGTPNSNAWSLISVSGASGSISQLEGWTLKLALQNGADLTVGNVKKFQGGCSIDIDQSSTLTFNSYDGGNDGERTTLNNYGTFNLAYTKSQGGEGFYVNLGATGIMNLTSSNGSSYNAKIASLTATLTLDGGTAQRSNCQRSSNPDQEPGYPGKQYVF